MNARATIASDTEETFDGLRERIRDRFDELSPHLQRIARFALDQPNQLALQTIAVIASETGVQPSTLIRFAKEFDYDGFSKLQQVFRLRLIEGGAGYREKIYERREREAPRPGDIAGTLDICVDALIASLENLRHEVNVEDLGHAVDLCRKARHIYIAGLRRSRPIATYLSYGLQRLERQCSLLDFGGGMAGQQVANMGHEDLLIAVAFPPYSAPVLDIVRDAHLRDLDVIAMTDAMTSPLARNATVYFTVDVEGAGPFRPISGAIGLAQALIVSLSE